MLGWETYKTHITAFDEGVEWDMPLPFVCSDEDGIVALLILGK